MSNKRCSSEPAIKISHEAIEALATACSEMAELFIPMVPPGWSDKAASISSKFRKLKTDEERKRFHTQFYVFAFQNAIFEEMNVNVRCALGEYILKLQKNQK